MAKISKRKWSNATGEHEGWVLSFTDANGKRVKRQFARKREADAERVKIEGQVATGTFRADASKLTVADAGKAYIEHLEARHGRDAKVTTTYLSTVRSELAFVTGAERSKHARRGTAFTEGIGDTRLSQLTSRTVGVLRDRMLRAGCSILTTRRVLATLARALDHARANDMIGTNPARGVKVVGTRAEGSKKIVPPARSQLQAVLKKAAPDDRLRIMFAALSGLRASEQWALRWRHLDLVSGEVTVETRVDIHGVEGTTKSTAGRRTVLVGKALVDGLEAWRKESKFSADDDLVFPLVLHRKAGDRATYVRHGNWYKRTYLPLLAAAGVGGLNWHSLRHYAISQWIAAGAPPKTVQTWAGHATLAITMDRYGHLFPSESHRTIVDSIGEDLAIPDNAE